MKAKAEIQIAQNEYFYPLLQILGGAFLLGLCSQIKITLPFTLVPLTLQTAVTLYLGARFGSRQAASMVILYFIQILMGWPVLAGGHANPLAFIGPKGGYILGFLIQAYGMGWWLERKKEFSLNATVVGGLTCCLIQLLMGVCWLSLFVGWKAVWILGFWPFVPGEIVKVLVCSYFLKKTY